MASVKMLDFTREFYRLPTTLKTGGVAIDPTALPIEFAIVLKGTKPATVDWKTGSWESAGTSYWARAFVGDSQTDHQIFAGNHYDVYFRLTDTPERPARLVGGIVAL